MLPDLVVDVGLADADDAADDRDDDHQHDEQVQQEEVLLRDRDVEQELEQVRVDDTQEARHDDRDHHDDDLLAIGSEEGGDASHRASASLARHGREVRAARSRRRRPRRGPSPPRRGCGSCPSPARPIIGRSYAGPAVRDGPARDHPHQAVAVAASAIALRLEPALGVDGRLAAVAGRGDRLAVAMVVDVAGDEHAVDRRAGLVVDDEVALLVDLAASRGTPRCWACSRSRRTARRSSRRSPRRSPCRGGAAPRPSIVAQDLGRPRCSSGPDLGVVDRAVLHDLAAPELVASMEHDGPRSRTASGTSPPRARVSPPPTTATFARGRRSRRRSRRPRRRGRAGASRCRGRATAPTRRSRR